MRIALFPFGSRGDVQPFIALGLTLVARGHEVVLGTSAVFRPLVEDHGLAFAEVGGDIEGFLRDHAEDLTRRPLRTLRAFFAFLEEEVARAFDETRAAAAGADLVVGASLQQAAPSVAASLGVPYRSVLYCPQLLPSSTYPPLNIASQDLPRMLNRLLWWAIVKAMNATLRAPVNRARARLALPPVDELLLHLRTTDPIVASDPPLGALAADARAGAQHTGALVLSPRGALPDDVRAFLDDGDAPIYFGFGSMAQRDPEGATRAILAAVDALGVRAIVAAGWGGLGGMTVPSTVKCIEGAPHGLLFPRCALVVHHGGAGTTHAAARAGVPQLVVPHAADQHWWGARVHALGVGPPALPRAKLTAARLTDRLRAARAPEHTTRARALALELARVDGNAATADALLAIPARTATPSSEARP